MNKKTRTKILIAIVGTVWIYNIYRTYMNYQVKQELDESEQVYNVPSFSPVMFNKDTFELELPDLDPFLKRHTSGFSNNSNHSEITQHTTTSNKKRNVPVEKVEPLVKSWPQIKYFGFIKNHDKEDALCLIQINGRNSKVTKGDNLSGVFISKVYRDSVLLVYEGEEKMFVKG